LIFSTRQILTFIQSQIKYYHVNRFFLVGIPLFPKDKAEMATRPWEAKGTLMEAVPFAGIRTTFQNPVGLNSSNVGEEISL
jgi:hypothetical protein